jgi:hypothetical protein
MLSRAVLSAVRPLQRHLQKAHMGGHGKPYVLRAPNNPRAKNEWDVLAEEMPPAQSDVYMAEFMGFCMWFWIMYSAYHDNGKAFVSLMSSFFVLTTLRRVCTSHGWRVTITRDKGIDDGEEVE